MSSAELSRQIYEQLGPLGLESRTNEQSDAETVELVLNQIGRQPRRVLDAGCGYGRIAIPLAKAGFDVVGIDICPAMLDEARFRADQERVTIEWLLGDIGELPFPDQSFDIVLCLWLTFHELLQENEQRTALRAMNRILVPGGLGLLDGPPFHKQGDDEPISGFTSPTDDTDEELAVIGFDHWMQQLGIVEFDQFVDDCPGRPRQFLKWRK